MTVKELNKIFNQYFYTEIELFRNGLPLSNEESIIADLEVKAVKDVKWLRSESYIQNGIMTPTFWSTLVLEVEVE